jgi:hypothetical protein
LSVSNSIHSNESIAQPFAVSGVVADHRGTRGAFTLKKNATTAADEEANGRSEHFLTMSYDLGFVCEY